MDDHNPSMLRPIHSTSTGSSDNAGGLCMFDCNFFSNLVPGHEYHHSRHTSQPDNCALMSNYIQPYTSVKHNSGFPHFASLFISFPYFYLLCFGILLLELGHQASTSKMTTKGTIKGILQTFKQVQSRIIIE